MINKTNFAKVLFPCVIAMLALTLLIGGGKLALTSLDQTLINHTHASLEKMPVTRNCGSKVQKARILESYGKVPLYFIENRGQKDKRVQYYAQGPGQTIYFTREGVYFSLSRADPQGGDLGQQRPGRPGSKTQPAGASTRKPPTVVRMQPVGLATEMKAVGLEPQAHRVNYFIGKDPQKWHADIPTYKAVVYRDAYPGIDLKFYGQGRDLEYDVVVRPGADPNRVRFQYAGVQKLEVTPAGDLALHLPDGGKLVQRRPVVYQEIAGKRLARKGKYRLHQQGAAVHWGFEVAAYDPRYPLVIDPVLKYSTYLGGSQYEYGTAIAVDAAGCAYVTGYTGSDDFPTHSPYQGTRQGLSDVFVTKFTAAGNALVYSTYLGGTDNDEGYGIAVDRDGYAYVTGTTYSNDFPVKNAFQDEPQGGRDAFVTKLATSGSSLIYSTYLGGSLVDGCRAIAVDSLRFVYVAGGSYSNNFPVVSAFQEERAGSKDATMTIFNDVGTPVFSTYLGGGSWDEALAIAVDSSRRVYVTGSTLSDDFPFLNPYQQYQEGEDVFVTKFNFLGRSLAYSTYLGGNRRDVGYGIAVDSSGCAYVTGKTISDNFPILNYYQGYQGEYDAFVTKLAASGSSLIYSTYLGGSLDDSGEAIAVDAAGCAYVAGDTYSEDFPIVKPYQTYQGTKECDDAFITIFPAGGQPPTFSTYLGSTDNDYARGIALDASNCFYVTGTTYDQDFPILNAFQSVRGGQEDAFVSKFGQGSGMPVAVFGLLLHWW